MKKFDAGRKLAVRVLRRHRLVELFLVKIMGINWTEVHEEAEALEHVVSERLVARMDEMLGFPAVDPHGDPIPSAEGVVPKAEYQDLLSCELGALCRVARVRDQSSAFLRLVERQGLMPGCRMTVEERDAAAETVELRLLPGGERVNLGFGAASKIFVEAVPAGLRQEESAEPAIRH
ncbi:MAG: metal-dependent transcriptional regulator [Acidobacteriota bacterium]|nr:metal-dependent transcriptional regulator [Acidobacteriota bacterium]